MFYYQILKQRRLALNLSIQQVSQQTRLKPEYVQALEEHNLEIFKDQGLPYVPALVEGYCDAIGVNWNVIAQEVQEDVQSFMMLCHREKRALPSSSSPSLSLISPQSPNSKKRETKAKEESSSFSKNKSSKIKKSKKSYKATQKKIKRKPKNKKNISSKKKPLKTKRKTKRVTWGTQNRLSKLILVSASCAILGLSMLNYFAQNAAQTSLAERKIAREKELLLEEATTQRLADEFKQRKYGLSSSEVSNLTIQNSTLTISNTDQLGTYKISGFMAQKKIDIELIPELAQEVQILWNNHSVFSQKVSDRQIYELNPSQNGTLTIVFTKGSDKNRLRLDNLDISSEYLLIDEKGQTKIQFLF